MKLMIAVVELYIMVFGINSHLRIHIPDKVIKRGTPDTSPDCHDSNNEPSSGVVFDMGGGGDKMI